MKLTSLTLASALALIVATTACEQKSPTAPPAPTPAAVIEGSAGESPVTDATTGITIGAPQPASPADGAQFKHVQQPVRLVISNGVTTGSTALTYTFEVAGDAGFASKVYAKDVAEAGSGQTSLTIDRIAPGRTYYWRARSNSGSIVGPNSRSRSFVVDPEVILQAPDLASATTDEQPTLTVNNVQRTGPAEQIFYRFDVSEASSFASLIYTATVPEQGGSTTQHKMTIKLVEKTYFWRVQASDPSNAVTTAFSVTNSFKPELFNWADVTILDSPDNFSKWPETATITRLTMGPTGINPEFTKKDGPDRWPDILPPGFEGYIYYCLGLAFKIDEHWYASAPIEMWFGRPEGGGPPSEYALNWFYNPVRWAPMTFHQPRVGETIGFFVTAGDTRGFNSNQKYQEKSNIVFVPQPDDRGAVYTFAPGSNKPLSISR